MAGPLQNLLLNIRANTSNAEQGFSRIENRGKKMARTLREEVTNPLKGAFEHVVGNAKSFVLSLIAVEKTLETIKRLFDRGRSTRDIANRFRISNQQAALINRTANVTGESADEIAQKMGLEERKLSDREVREIATAIAQQNPFSVAAEAHLADKTFSADVAGRKALETSSKGVLAPKAILTPTSRFNPTVTSFTTRPNNDVPAGVRQAERGLIYRERVGELIKELQEIKKNTADTAKATKQDLAF